MGTLEKGWNYVVYEAAELFVCDIAGLAVLPNAQQLSHQQANVQLAVSWMAPHVRERAQTRRQTHVHRFFY